MRDWLEIAAMVGWFVIGVRFGLTLAARRAKRAKEAKDDAEFASGYDCGLAVGRAFGAPIHRTYVVDLATFQRIKELEFLSRRGAPEGRQP